jgi:hypothetical protein
MTTNTRSKRGTYVEKALPAEPCAKVSKDCCARIPATHLTDPKIPFGRLSLLRVGSSSR